MPSTIAFTSCIRREAFPGQPCHELIASGMAINYLGLGIAEDDRCNWGLLRLFEDGHAEATLVDRHGTNPCWLNW